MTLDDRSRLLHPKHRTGECLRQTGYKEAILIDLEKLIEDNCIYGNEQESKAKLLKEVRKYCE